nr:putative exported protein [uncultured bacterium]
MNRRDLLLTSAALPFAMANAQSQSTPRPFPTKPVRLIVPYPTGTTTETFARVMARKLSDLWGQPVVVDVITGAGGVVGSQVVATAPLDGYTLGWIANAHAINAALYRNLPFDTVGSFRPIASLVSVPLILAATPTFEGSSVADLVKAAKARPGEVEFGSLGNGSGMHLAMERFAAAAGIKLKHIPYKSSGQLITDLVAGRIRVGALGLSLALPQTQSGNLKALGITSTTRSALAPAVPTISESIPGFEFVTWNGLVAPKGTPDVVVRSIAKDALGIMKEESMQETLSKLGVQADVMDSELFARRIESDIRIFRKVVADANIQID